MTLPKGWWIPFFSFSGVQLRILGARYWLAVVRWLQEREQFTKYLIVALADFFVLTGLVFVAYALRISRLELPPQGSLALYFIAPCLSVASASVAGLYRFSSRSYSSHMDKRLVLSQLAVPVLWSLLLFLRGAEGFARSTVLIYAILSIVGMVMLRRGAAELFKAGQRSGLPRREQIPILVYGAGREGVLLVQGLRQQGRYRPIAFIDTDYTLVGRHVEGLKVWSSEDLDAAIDRYGPQEVIIAKPQQSRAHRRTLVNRFLERGLLVKSMPGIDEITDGKVDIGRLRPIRLEDLLGRDPVPPDQMLMEKAVKGKVVMVSGAGGSIGSEIVRQVSGFGPASIIMVDSSEFSLFEINRDMENRVAGKPDAPKLVAALGDIQDRNAMEGIMRRYGVEVVFHAAAYKHVRLVQENAAAGIHNNVWGTWTLADAAIAQGVKLFVMISTDKAVRPTSVMGATKRVAEMVIQQLAARPGNKPVFAMVRFGNVLGSTGSVVPLFNEQIARGGPVLVTHPDVTRFFMLIPEAAQLVIQAGAMADGGEVFVLDMGESVKIIQLAETMIELAGLSRRTPENPDGDIEIKFTGLREGEKLYEELQIGRDISQTSHPRIMKSREFEMPDKDFRAAMKDLKASLDAGDSHRATQQVLELAFLGSEISQDEHQSAARQHWSVVP